MNNTSRLATMNFYFVLFLFFSVVHATTRHLQSCSTTTEEFDFSGLFVLELEGQTGRWTPIDSQVLEYAVQVAYSCREADGGDGFYRLHNVTVEPPLYFGGPLGLDTIRNVSLPVFVRGSTSLTQFESGALFGDEDSNPDDDGCSCPLPNKEAFLDQISRRMMFNSMVVERIIGIQETEEVECPSDTVEFSSGMAMESQGDVDVVDAKCLQTLAEAVASLYNQVNILNPETCDEQFREVTAAVAVLDESSVVRGDEMEQRKLQVTTSPIPSSSPTVSSVPSTSMTPTTSTIPSDSPTSTPSAEPTTATPHPTARAADLYLILIQLEGLCRGCTKDAFLFDQTDRRNRALGEEDVYRGSFHGRGLAAPFDRCYCAAGAERGPPTEEGFLQAWRMERLILGIDMPCISAVDNIEEIRIFDCNATESRFKTYLEAQFVGNFMALTEDEVMRIEESIVELYEDLQEQVCDPFLRSLVSIRTVRRGIAVTEVPSSSPSELPSETPSSEPSTMPSADGRRRLQDSVPSNSPSVSSSPSISKQPSPLPTENPTFAPTSGGADLFFLVFELTGQCRGCDTDAGLFNQLGIRSRRALRRLDETGSTLTWKNAGSRRLQSDDGICGCGLESPDGGVTEQEFITNLGDTVEDLELENVKTLEQATVVVSAPTEDPSESSTPSSTPSLSSKPAVLDATDPTDLASEPPSTKPSLSPSEVPSRSPTQAPTALPSTGFPSETPSIFPSETPSAFPSVSPSTSGLPSGTPTQAPFSPPSDFSSAVPSEEPSDFPTQGPTDLPSPTPTVCGPEAWHCYSDSNDLFVARRTDAASLTCPTTSEEIDSDPARVQYDTFGSVFLYAPCCSSGSIEVSVGCDDENSVTYQLGNTGADGEISTACPLANFGDGFVKFASYNNVEANTPIFVTPLSNFVDPDSPICEAITPAPAPAPACTVQESDANCHSEADSFVTVDHSLDAVITCTQGFIEKDYYEAIFDEEGDVTISVPCCTSGDFVIVQGCTGSFEVYSLNPTLPMSVGRQISTGCFAGEGSAIVVVIGEVPANFPIYYKPFTAMLGDCPADSGSPSQTPTVSTS